VFAAGGEIAAESGVYESAGQFDGDRADLMN
jgi:hypothetical protein